MREGTYIGPQEDLKGKTAVLLSRPGGMVRAQFNDIETGMGFGWYLFRFQDFEIHFDPAFD